MHVEWICFSLKCKLWIVRFRTSRVSQQMCIKLIVGLIVLKLISLCVYLIDLRWLGQEWKPDCLYVISGSLYENMMKSRPSKTKFHCNYLMSSFRNWHGTGCVVWTVSKQWYCYNCSILPTYCRLCNGSYLPGRKPTTPLLCSAIIVAILYAQLNDALPKKKKKLTITGIWTDQTDLHTGKCKHLFKLVSQWVYTIFHRSSFFVLLSGTVKSPTQPPEI